MWYSADWKNSCLWGLGATVLYFLSEMVNRGVKNRKIMGRTQKATLLAAMEAKVKGSEEHPVGAAGNGTRVRGMEERIPPSEQNRQTVREDEKTYQLGRSFRLPVPVDKPTKNGKPIQGRVLIGTNTSVPESLRKCWEQIGCVSVSSYLQAVTSAVAELKWEVNRIQENTTTDMELLVAFGCAVQDRRKKEKYSAAACRLLVTEWQDMDAVFLDPDEAEVW